MKELICPDKMQKGRVYNVEYVGENKAYAKINGKRTILVKATSPQLEYLELYCQSGSPMFNDLHGSIMSATNPLTAFNQCEITEPVDESEWFKHSLRVNSIGEGVEQGLITVDDIKKVRVRSSLSPFTSFSDHEGKYLGTYISFNVEDKTKYHQLQRVYVCWNSWDEMYDDFERYGVNVKGMKKIFLTLKKTWELPDGARPGQTTSIAPGRYEFVRIPNPFGHQAPWLVLKGTLTGACEAFLRDWQNSVATNNLGQPNSGKAIDWGDFEIVIEEVEW